MLLISSSLFYMSLRGINWEQILHKVFKNDIEPWILIFLQLNSHRNSFWPLIEVSDGNVFKVNFHCPHRINKNNNNNQIFL